MTIDDYIYLNDEDLKLMPNTIPVGFALVSPSIVAAEEIMENVSLIGYTMYEGMLLCSSVLFDMLSVSEQQLRLHTAAYYTQNSIERGDVVTNAHPLTRELLHAFNYQNTTKYGMIIAKQKPAKRRNDIYANYRADQSSISVNEPNNISRKDFDKKYVNDDYSHKTYVGDSRNVDDIDYLRGIGVKDFDKTYVGGSRNVEDIDYSRDIGVKDFDRMYGDESNKVDVDKTYEGSSTNIDDVVYSQGIGISTYENEHSNILIPMTSSKFMLWIQSSIDRIRLGYPIIVCCKTMTQQQIDDGYTFARRYNKMLRSCSGRVINGIAVLEVWSYNDVELIVNHRNYYTKYNVEYTEIDGKFGYLIDDVFYISDKRINKWSKFLLRYYGIVSTLFYS